jgi:HTH-type transcriptional regulator/antitoxin HigA
MDVRPIRTEQQNEAALREIERLWGAPAGSPEGDRLEVLAMLVEDYERRAYPIPDADPVDILRFAIEDMGRSQKELGELLGSQSRASEILSRKRRLTVEMIARIGAAWHLPVAALMKPYPTTQRSRSMPGKSAPPAHARTRSAGRSRHRSTSAKSRHPG